MARKIRVAINGFGRIGRLVFRAALESGRSDVEFVAANDLMPPEQSEFLLEFDSVHGRLGAEQMRAAKNMKIISVSDPAKLPWKELDVDAVMECSGIFTAADKARVHIDAGAKRVLVSAPSDGADKTIVFGVNDKTLGATDVIVSNGSCTTNCLAPIALILDEEFGIEKGWMTTIHSYTGDQQLLDRNHTDFRRARAANLSIIPSSTGAAKAIGLVLPNLAGKLDGAAIRVPTPDVSITELTAITKKKISAAEANEAMRRAAAGKLKGILGYNELPLVSSDFTHNALSSIFDATMTKVVGDNMIHIASWYDNEWGFSNRMLDVAAAMATAK